MQHLKNAPLLSFVSLFLVGCILGSYNTNWFTFVSLFLVLFTALLLFFKIGTFRFHLFFFAAFLSLGCLRMKSEFPKSNRIYNPNQEQFAIVEIEQQLRKGDKWETNIGQIHSVLVDNKWKETDEHVLFISELSSSFLRIGDRVLVKTKIQPITNLGNPGEFDARYYWLSKGVRYQCFGFSNQLKLLESKEPSLGNNLLVSIRGYTTSLFDKYIGKEQSAIVKAIFLGDKSDLDLETKNSFANAGAMHVLAVSGLHVGIITLIILWFFEHAIKGIKRNTAMVLLIALLWGYAFVTGFSASVTRSVLMFSMLGIAQISGKVNNPINTLAFSALVLMVWNPTCIFDIGFQLSYLAVLGIFVSYSKVEKLVYIKNKQLQWLWKGTAVGISAQIFTAPISIYYFHQFPNFFMLSNIPVMLFAGVILGGAIVLIIIGKVPFLNALVGSGLFAVAYFLTESIRWIESLPGAVALGFEVSEGLLFFTYLVILLILFDVSRKRKIIWAFILLPVFVFLHLPRIHNYQKNEICVFNSKATIILAKLGREQICVFEGNENAELDAKLKVKDYQKINPGKVTFYKIDNKRIILKNKEISLVVEGVNKSIVLKREGLKNIRIITSNFFDKNDSVSYENLLLKSNVRIFRDIAYNLERGAFRTDL